MQRRQHKKERHCPETFNAEEALAAELVAKGVAIERFQGVDEIVDTGRAVGLECRGVTSLEAEVEPNLRRLERLTGAVIRFPWLGRRALARRSPMRGRNVITGYLMYAAVALGVLGYGEIVLRKPGWRRGSRLAHLPSRLSRSLLRRFMYSRSESGAFRPGGFGGAPGGGARGPPAPARPLPGRHGRRRSRSARAGALAAHCSLPNRLGKPSVASRVSGMLRSTTRASPSRAKAAVEKSRGLSESIETTRHWPSGSPAARFARVAVHQRDARHRP